MEGRVTVMKTSLNNARCVVRAIGESFFPIFFIVLMIIIYDTVGYMYGTETTTTTTNGYQHLSNRHDQPTTTTITDNLLNDDDCGAVRARAPVM